MHYQYGVIMPAQAKQLGKPHLANVMKKIKTIQDGVVTFVQNGYQVLEEYVKVLPTYMPLDALPSWQHAVAHIPKNISVIINNYKNAPDLSFGAMSWLLENSGESVHVKIMLGGSIIQLEGGLCIPTCILNFELVEKQPQEKQQGILEYLMASPEGKLRWEALQAAFNSTIEIDFLDGRTFVTKDHWNGVVGFTKRELTPQGLLLTVGSFMQHTME